MDESMICKDSNRNTHHKSQAYYIITVLILFIDSEKCATFFCVFFSRSISSWVYTSYSDILKSLTRGAQDFNNITKKARN